MTFPLALGMPSWPQLLFILMIVLVLFGAKRLPELARGLAQSLNEFRKIREEFENELHKPSTSTASTKPKIEEPEGKQTHQS